MLTLIYLLCFRIDFITSDVGRELTGVSLKDVVKDNVVTPSKETCDLNPLDDTVRVLGHLLTVAEHVYTFVLDLSDSWCDELPQIL